MKMNKLKRFEKPATLDELKEFLSKRLALNITALCRDAGVPRRIWAYLLSDKKPLHQDFTFNDFCEKTMREKLRPVMRKYGHKK